MKTPANAMSTIRDLAPVEPPAAYLDRATGTSAEGRRTNALGLWWHDLRGAREARARALAARVRAAAWLACQGMAVASARRYRGSGHAAGIPFDDLVSAAQDGIALAIERLDPAQGALTTIAQYCCDTAVTNYLTSRGVRLVHVPRYHIADARASARGRLAGVAAVALRGVRSLDAMRCPPPSAAAPADDDGPDAEELDRLRAALAALDPREAACLRARFGLGDAERLTLEETGRLVLGVCKERARQIEARALARLAAALSPDRPDPTPATRCA